MPTRGRPQLAAIALECAIRQDYDPSRMEILIFDDEDDPSFIDPLPAPAAATANIRYFRGQRLLFPTLGDKRNAMCEEAYGEIIAHIDSDDLSAPNRISTQVRSLTSGNASISGFHTVPFYDISTGGAYLYHLNKAYVCGTTLVYRWNFWREHPFPSVDIGEDLPYTSGNFAHRTAASGWDMIVALLHDGNMSSRKQARTHPIIFPPISADSLPAWFQERRKLLAAG